MSTTLTATKLYKPSVGGDLVPRSRLLDHLDNGLMRRTKLTLICAPAGFGKTTLLLSWLQHLDCPVAWLSLDAGDDSPNRFWRYVVAALQTLDTAIGETVQIALSSAHPADFDELIPTLINDIIDSAARDGRLRYPTILVLDDYYLIKNRAIHDSLNVFLDHLPPQLHVVITTREDPPLMLSRRRVRLEMTEIRAADLRFNHSEVHEFLNSVMTLDLSEEQSSMLAERTEGWIVGLQLAALSMQSAGFDKHQFVEDFAGDDRFVADYLMDEVLQRQPEVIQVFLMQTSILDRLCGPLCDALRQQGDQAGMRKGADLHNVSFADANAILEYLEKINLFLVPLDNRRYWYRYHQLFADLLRQRLHQSTSTADVARLYRRAGEWYESAGLISEAVSCALSIPDLEFAAEILERNVLTLFYRSEMSLIHDWLGGLPEDVLHKHPLLIAVYAATTALSPPYPPDSSALSAQRLQTAEDLLVIAQRDAPVSRQAIHSLTASFIEMFWAYLARFRADPPQTVLVLSQKALNTLPPAGQDAPFAGDYARLRSALTVNLGFAYYDLGDEEKALLTFAQGRKMAEAGGDFLNACAVASIQANSAYSHGKLHQAASICQESLKFVSGFGYEVIPYAGILYIAWGRILFEWFDLDEAERILTKGLALAKLTYGAGMETDGLLLLARIRQARGDIPNALALIEQAEQLRPTNAGQVMLYRVRLWLGQAESHEAYHKAVAEWVQGNQLGLDDNGQYDDIQLTLIQCRIVLCQIASQTVHPELPSMLRYLDTQYSVAIQAGRIGWAIEVLILSALVLQVQGDQHQAMTMLQRALTLAEPEDYVRLFVEQGQSMRKLLLEMTKRSSTLDFARRLIAAFPTQGQDATATSPASEPMTALPEALSPRELEVLRLFTTGMSIREMASKLYIAPNTLKKHITSIYGKLNAKNRVSAIARARETGLLD